MALSFAAYISFGNGWDKIRCNNNNHQNKPAYLACIQTKGYRPTDPSNINRRLFEIGRNSLNPNPRLADVLFRLIPALRGEFSWDSNHPTLTRLADFSEELWPIDSNLGFQSLWHERLHCRYDFTRGNKICN